MKTPTHTPGPWKVQKVYEDAYGLCYEISAETEKYRNTYIALLEESRYSAPQVGWSVEANAALIAAAPELLKAVKLFRRFFDEMPKGQFGKISCDIGLMNDAFIESGKAILKAEAK